MVKEEMNITRALTELKRINANIEDFFADKGIQRYSSITIGDGDSKRVYNQPSLSVDKVSAILTGSVSKIKALFARRTGIKSAIVKSNAVTQITFNGKQITVAEAIELRASLPLQKRFLDDMRKEHRNVSGALTELNNKLQIRIDNLVSEATKNVICG